MFLNSFELQVKHTAGNTCTGKLYIAVNCMLLHVFLVSFLKVLREGNVIHQIISMSISYIEAFWFRFLLWITPPNKSHWCVWQVWCRSSAARWDVGGACGPWLLHSDPTTGGHIQPDSPPSTAATAEWSPGESPLFLPASSSQHL